MSGIRKIRQTDAEELQERLRRSAANRPARTTDRRGHDWERSRQVKVRGAYVYVLVVVVMRKRPGPCPRDVCLRKCPPLLVVAQCPWSGVFLAPTAEGSVRRLSTFARNAAASWVCCHEVQPLTAELVLSIVAALAARARKAQECWERVAKTRPDSARLLRAQSWSRPSRDRLEPTRRT